jgi:hypothetical protein
MSERVLEGVVLDWEGFLPKVKPRLISSDPFCPGPFLDFPHTETNHPSFALTLTDEEVPSPNFRLCFIGYYPSFRPETIQRINEWAERNPRKHFLVVIFNFVPKSWSTFTTSKAKVEEEFNQFDIDAPTHVLKYDEGDSQPISSGDLQSLHEKVEVYIAFTLNRQLKRLSENADSGANSTEETYRLARLLCKLGFYTGAIHYFTKLKLPGLERFWPSAPLFYDITRDEIDDVSSGLSILCSAMASFFKSSIESKQFDPLYEYITRCFAVILEHCQTDLEFVFARNFIQHTSTIFANRLQDGSPDRCGTFSLIAMEQLARLPTLKADWSSSFLGNIPAEKRDIRTLESLFLLEWSRSRQIRQTGFPIHRVYFAALLFRFLCLKQDFGSARSVLADNGIDFVAHERVVTLFESHIIGQLFDWTPTQKIAENVIESRLPDDVKIRALAILTRVYPSISIRPLFRAPAILTPVPLFSTVPFSLTFSPPSFLIGKTVPLHLKFKSDEHTITTVPQIQSLDSARVSFVSELRCSFAGSYGKLILCILLDNCKLRWRVPIELSLIVDTYHNLPQLSLRSPWFLSATSERQGAVFNLDHIDAECREVSIAFSSRGLLGFEYGGREFAPTEELSLTTFERAMEILLTMDYRLDDQITAVFRYVLKDGQQGEMLQTFDFPDRKSFDVTLFNQSGDVQQVQIRNVFPIGFTIDFLGKRHVMRPCGRYHLMRPVTTDPLELTFIEDGWDAFPVSVSCQFEPAPAILDIQLDMSDWSVGESRIAILGDRATVLPVENSDWVIAPVGLTQTEYLLIPRRPGRLKIPIFVVRQHVVQCSISSVQVYPVLSPQFLWL